MTTIYNNQIIAANNICNAFITDNIRYAVLKALCQSGKTGAFHTVIQNMFRDGHIQRVYILCGSNETELREQAIQDTMQYNSNYIDDIYVWFRQDFDKNVIDPKNSLIIVDESHMDQNQGQKLHQFLGSVGITMDGNPRVLAENNTYILSVSATPYSEIAALVHKETPYKKHVENLEPGQNYFGLKQYFDTNSLLPTFDINANQRRFEILLRNHVNKWILIRLHSKKNPQVHIIKYIAAKINVRVCFFNATKSDISIDDLNVAPERTTIVIINGRLRAGKVVPKKHIGFVWEGAFSSKTDALVQGLPGRMCGYEFGTEKPVIFVPPSSLKKNNNKVVKCSEIERAIIDYPNVLPTKGTNLTKPHLANIAVDQNGRRLIQCPPIRLAIPCDDDEFSLLCDWETINGENLDIVRSSAMELLGRNTELIDEHPTLTINQKNEIKNNIRNWSNFTPSIRRTQPLLFKQVIEAWKTNTAVAEHISSFPKITFTFFNQGEQRQEFSAIPGANPRFIYVIFYTSNENNEELKAVHLKSRISETNKKSVFSINKCDVARPFAAVGAVTIPVKATKNPAALKSALNEYIMTWRNATDIDVARRIQCVKKRFAFCKRTFHYQTTANNDVQKILSELSTLYNIKLKASYVRGSDTSFNVSEISW
jgi:hypothetical protein